MKKQSTAPEPAAVAETCSTIEASRLMGVAVRSVQLMVDRGELDAWKTAGGHRRIARASVQRWVALRQGSLQGAGVPGALHREGAAVPAAPRPAGPALAPVTGVETGVAPLPATDAVGGSSAVSAEASGTAARPRVLLIEDSAHFQNLLRLLVAQKFPDVELHVADDGIAGLALAGQLRPQVLIVDILLPGIDGATLITSLRSHPQFKDSRLIVVTSLDEDQRAPYAFALAGVPVVHKPQLVMLLPPLLRQALDGVVPEAVPALSP